MRGTRLAWSAGSGAAVWQLDGLETVMTKAPSAIRIAVADGRRVEDSDGVPLPVFVRLTAGPTSVRLPLSSVGAVPPPLPVRLLKHDLLADVAGMDVSVRAASEIVLQTYELPLAMITATAPGLELEALTSMAVEVDRTADGALWIAEPALLP